MILAKAGVLSTAQDLTVGTTDSENVIDLSAADYVGITDLWLTVQTETIATGDGSDTYEFKLVVASEATLDTVKEVCKVIITGYEDSRIATAGNNILCVNIGKMLKEVATSTYRYAGLMSIISSGATISINASLSPSEPKTDYHAQVVASNVTVPAPASAGS